jgi:energy-coupling factor transporter ATP-binding protein EcfA2
MTTPTDNALVSSDFNLTKLDTAQLYENLKYSISMGSNVVIIGRRGSGKTQIAKQVIAESDCDEIYINLSVAERTDMGGYPDMFGTMKKASDAEKARLFVDVLLPKFFSPLLEGDRPCIALLDEVDKADPSIWAPLLEFLQFKSINGTPLKNLRGTIATGNLISEGGKRPSLPLLDRAEKYLVEASVDHWLKWAGNSNQIHPACAAYVQDHPNHLFASTETEDNYADPSPRGWHLASTALFELEKRHAPKDIRINKVSGYVGKQTGILFDMYYNYYEKILPMVNGLFEGKNTKETVNAYEKVFNPQEKLVATMIICGRLATIADSGDKDTKKIFDRVGKFLVNVDSDNILVGMRSQFGIQRMTKYKLTDDPIWKEVIGKVVSSMTVT